MKHADNATYTGIRGGAHAVPHRTESSPRSATDADLLVMDDIATSEDMLASDDQPATFQDEREMMLCGGLLSDAAEAVGRLSHSQGGGDISPFAKSLAADIARYPTRNHHMRL